MDHGRILIAEDEELVALAIKKCLEGFGYEVPCVVSSGEEAVRKSETLEADLVLMDIHLQGKMNGIDAAGLIKDSTRVPVVYLTAYSDADTLDKAKITEPFGFILKPFEEKALEATVKMALSRSRAQKELAGTHDRMSSILHSVGDGIVVTEASGVIEYANARARALLQLPDHLPPSSSIFPHVSLTYAEGKEPVALHLDEVVLNGQSVKLARHVVTRLNTMFCDGHSQMFFTIAYGVIDRHHMKLRMARAGHPYPVVVKKDGSREEIQAGGNAVGLSSTFAVEESETALAPGDRLFIYSDGITECTDSRGAQFSRPRLLDLLVLTLGEELPQAVARIRKEVTTWRGRESFDDDVSLMALEAQPRS